MAAGSEVAASSPQATTANAANSNTNSQEPFFIIKDIDIQISTVRMGGAVFDLSICNTQFSGPADCFPLCQAANWLSAVVGHHILGYGAEVQYRSLRLSPKLGVSAVQVPGDAFRVMPVGEALQVNQPCRV